MTTIKWIPIVVVGALALAACKSDDRSVPVRHEEVRVAAPVVGLDTLDYFVGTWRCRVDDAANEIAPATVTSDVQYTFRRAPARIEIDIKPFPATATRYWTFDAQTRTFAFEAHVGRGAAAVTMAGTSPGWSHDQLVWTGTLQTATPARQTFIKRGVAKFELVSEMSDGAAWRVATRSTCVSHPATASGPRPTLPLINKNAIATTREYDFEAIDATDDERERADDVGTIARARIDDYVASVQDGRADKGDTMLATIQHDEHEALTEIFGRDRTAMLLEADREHPAEGPP
ncbi:MAG TPA: hypothetical protein VF403_04090 [Kofleriaceae bacterium]